MFNTQEDNVKWTLVLFAKPVLLRAPSPHKASFSLFALEIGSQYTTQTGPKLMLFLCKHTAADITGLHHHIQPFVGFDIFVFQLCFYD